MQKTATVDEKGRVSIPAEFRDALGDKVIVTRTDGGVLLIPGKGEDFLSEFQKMIGSEPKRSGKPANPPPAKMKAVWHEKP